MKKTLLFTLLLPLFAIGQIPEYYNNIDFSKGKENIKKQITYLITQTHNEIGYNEVWSLLERADEDPDNKNNVLLIYGHTNVPNESEIQSRTRKKTAQGRGGSLKGKWNREHVFAKSLATPKLIGQGNRKDAGSDAHNLRAADARWNSTRNNRIFSEAQGVAHTIGTREWYPGDEWKGDVARIIMYMYIRYGNRTQANTIGAGGNSIYKIPDIPDIFIKWNIEDPVSDFERRRNQEIYHTQTNRNPFIDNPYLATLIWGGDKAEDTWGLEAMLNTQDPFQQKKELLLYPSVTYPNENINITEEVNNIEIFSMEGRLVERIHKKTQSFKAPDQRGVYIIRLLTSENNKPISKKIIVK